MDHKNLQYWSQAHQIPVPMTHRLLRKTPLDSLFILLSTHLSLEFMSTTVLKSGKERPYSIPEPQKIALDVGSLSKMAWLIGDLRATELLGAALTSSSVQI